MTLPIPLTYAPMEAKSALKIPEGPDWQYEPKWDGFRCLAFRDGEEVEIQSKSSQPLARYFPEIADALKKLEAKKFVLDGEIVIELEHKLSFDALLQRIHPAASRILKLSTETPGTLILFDLLVDEKGTDLTGLPLEKRRPKLETFAQRFLEGQHSVVLSPATPHFQEAKAWFETMIGDLDGVMAKRTDLPYESGNREGMLKIKNLRTADCVIGGFRYAEKGGVVGSLLLGLYDEKGLLHHVGFTSGIAASEKEKLTARLEKLIAPPGFTGQAPGGPSRWSTERSNEWKPLKPDLVIEIQYDHFSGGRFRHGTRLLRWRPDKGAAQCTLAQVERDTCSPLNLLGDGSRGDSS